jgi:dTDP-glucose 4,6-dehydratase
MRILVTGGAGFIGSHFVELLLEKNESVHIVDKMTYAGNPLNLSKKVQLNCNFRQLDIANKKELRQYFDNFGPFDCIVNFAAESHVDRSIIDSSPFIDSNIKGMVNLLELTKLGGSKKIIQVSTDEVYGSINNGSWDEYSILDPRSPYSASKVSAEMMCFAFKNTYGIDVLITRSANNFGPKQSVEKLIPKSICSVLSGLPINIYGDGENLREWLYVLDHCDVIYKLSIKQITDYFVYNISGTEFSNIFIAEKLLSLSPNNSKIEYVADRLGHDFRYSVSDQRIRKELDWVPKFSFAESFVKTFEWYKNNSEWVNESKRRLNI